MQRSCRPARSNIMQTIEAQPKMLESEQEDNFRQNDNGQQFDYPDYEMEI